jgi:hypothetical protein
MSKAESTSFLTARIVTVGILASWAASASTSASSSSGATAALIIPIAAARSAGTSSPLNRICLARCVPTSRGSIQAPPIPGVRPRRIQNSPSEASVEPITMSHASARSQPPPTATPLSRAMTGLGSSRIPRIMRWAISFS